MATGTRACSEETGFTIIGNTDLDEIVRAFMNVQGGLVGYIQWFMATCEVKVLMFKDNVLEPVFRELIRSTAA